MRNGRSANLLWFLAGLGFGTAAGIVLAPKPGSETRRMIGGQALHAREYVSTQGHDAFERGRELYEMGRQLADEAAVLFDEGRRLMEAVEAGKA